MEHLEFYRGPEWFRETRQLKGTLYNRARSLLLKSGSSQVFVPIRSMQYLAILGEDEFVFIDGMGGRTIELAWQQFRVGARRSIHDPVSYDWVAYDARACDTMHRLPGAFERALVDLENKGQSSGEAVIVPIHRD